MQARAGAAAAFSHTTQYLGNQANGVIRPAGSSRSTASTCTARGASSHQELSPNALLRHAAARARRPAEAAAQAKLEIAQRGLAVTVTRSYYALVTAQRKYATAQQAAQQAQRFFDDRAAAGAARAGGAQRRRQGGDPVPAAAAGVSTRRRSRWTTRGSRSPCCCFPRSTRTSPSSTTCSARRRCRRLRKCGRWRSANNPDLRAADAAAARPPTQDVRVAKNAFSPDRRRRRGLRHRSQRVRAAQPRRRAARARRAAEPRLLRHRQPDGADLGLGRPAQQAASERDARSARRRSTLSQAQRQLVGNLYSMYNEALAAQGGRRQPAAASRSSRPKACD